MSVTVCRSTGFQILNYLLSFSGNTIYVPILSFSYKTPTAAKWFETTCDVGHDNGNSQFSCTTALRNSVTVYIRFPLRTIRPRRRFFPPSPSDFQTLSDSRQESRPSSRCFFGFPSGLLRSGRHINEPVTRFVVSLRLCS